MSNDEIDEIIKNVEALIDFELELRALKDDEVGSEL